MKKILVSIATLLSAISSYAIGDYAIVPQNLNGTIALGDTAIVKITISNNGTAYRINSLMATSTAPGNGKYVGLVNNATYQSSTIWSIQSLSNENTGNTIILTNTGGGLGAAPFDPNASTAVYVYLVGKTVSSPTIFGANIGFSIFPSDSLASYSTQGNTLTSNDNNSSSLTVTTPLPLDFTGINAAWNKDNAEVNWKVAREENNSHFIVERSFDGKNFTEAGRVKSRGNYMGERNYSYIDYGVKAKTSDKVYYRVRQVDLNGKSTTTEIVSLKAGKSDNSNAYLFPNPARNSVKFVYENNTLEEKTDLKIRLTDMHGRTVLEKTMPVAQGKNEIVLDVSAIASGCYHLNYNNDANAIKGSLKVVKD